MRGNITRVRLYWYIFLTYRLNLLYEFKRIQISDICLRLFEVEHKLITKQNMKELHKGLDRKMNLKSIIKQS